MLKNENIICISSIDWDFIWQGHQEIMSTLARNGNRVIFIENTGVRSPGIRDIPRLKKRIKNYLRGVKGIRKEQDNLYIFSPIVLPFPYSWIARKINRYLLLSVLERWMKVIDFPDPIIWAFLPTGITLDIINNVNKKIIIYYCIDNFLVSSSGARKVRTTEKKLLRQADLVFVTAKGLYDYCLKENNNIHIFPFGVNIDNFTKIRLTPTERPKEIKDIAEPIIGYVGGIHKWIDQRLVKDLALSSPDLAFVFIGPLQTDVSSLSNINNIYFLGNKSHQDLPILVKYFSVAMIPYLITDYTKNVYPTKLNEYLSMAKPVISTALPEVAGFNRKHKDIVYIAADACDFAKQIRNAIAADNDKLRHQRIQAANDNGWGSRIEKMSSIIEESIERKKSDREARWKESLLVFYRATRRKFIRLTLTLGLCYSLIFYTPFVWFLAEPLKIVDKPQQADTIVVFAGGVGESGKAGQGYEERVQQAVNLYKEGYARYIIFSSGYMYIYKEPLLMKALAVSLGVPEAAIILEDKAGSTYKNVDFVVKILRSKGWRKILLVTSPYHMRRASLVFKKVAKEITVVYTPTQVSLFYSYDNTDSSSRKKWKTINLQQLRGILHEYLGILYYYWKGYA